MNPNEVNFTFTLKLDQINLILEGLGMLPLNRSMDFVTALRAETLRQLQAAEQQALEAARAAEAQAELPVSPETVQ